MSKPLPLQTERDFGAEHIAWKLRTDPEFATPQQRETIRALIRLIPEPEMATGVDHICIHWPNGRSVCVLRNGVVTS